jgi:hypothetical protein
LRLGPETPSTAHWQEAGGLLVPLYDWVNDNVVGESRCTLTFTAVKFSTDPPDKADFARPADAMIAPLK